MSLYIIILIMFCVNQKMNVTQCIVAYAGVINLIIILLVVMARRPRVRCILRFNILSNDTSAVIATELVRFSLLVYACHNSQNFHYDTTLPTIIPLYILAVLLL